jgi:NAD-dependent deacetylase
LPGAVIQRARELARESDAFLAIGSSLVVEPAASLPRLAASTGATVGIVNLESTQCDGIADAVVRGDVTSALPRLRELVVD